MASTTEPRTYADMAEVTFLGKRLKVLDLSREVSPSIPVYPGHMKISFWDHLTHEESRLRIGAGPFRGYAVSGIVMCDHVSTHMDAVWHYNPDRRDLSIDRVPIEIFFTEGVWIDVSDAPPRTSISLNRVRLAMAQGGINQLPKGGALLYYTGAARRWDNPTSYVSEYSGLDEEASRWILDQGVINVLTDAVSTDNPADLTYPNHRVHAEYLINHTEVVNNIDRIPMHHGFSVLVAPLKLAGCTASPVRVFALWEA